MNSGQSVPAPPCADALDLAQAALQRGDGLAALDILRGIIASPPLLGERWAVVAQLCSQIDDDDAALLAARRLWNAVPRGVPTAFILARALEATGRNVSSQIPIQKSRGCSRPAAWRMTRRHVARRNRRGPS